MKALVFISMLLAWSGNCAMATQCLPALSVLSQRGNSEDQFKAAYSQIINELPTQTLGLMVEAGDAFFKPEDIRSEFASVFDGLDQVRALIPDAWVPALFGILSDIYQKRIEAERRAIRVARRISLRNAKARFSIRLPGDKPVGQLLFAPDGQSIYLSGETSQVSGRKETGLKVWDFPHSELWTSLTPIPGRAAFGFDSDQRLVIVTHRLAYPEADRNTPCHSARYTYLGSKQKFRMFSSELPWNVSWTRLSDDGNKVVLIREMERSREVQFDVFDLKSKTATEGSVTFDEEVSFIGGVPSLSSDGRYLSLKLGRVTESPPYGWLAQIDTVNQIKDFVYNFKSRVHLNTALTTTAGDEKELFIIVRDAIDASLVRHPYTDEHNFGSPVTGIALSPPLNLLFLAQAHGTHTKIVALDRHRLTEQSLRIPNVESHSDNFRGFRISQDGKFLLTHIGRDLNVYSLEDCLD